jgi:hypothetical protein
MTKRTDVEIQDIANSIEASCLSNASSTHKDTDSVEWSNAYNDTLEMCLDMLTGREYTNYVCDGKGELSSKDVQRVKDSVMVVVRVSL